MPRINSQTQKYVLDTLVSVNDLCQSWLGRVRSTGAARFIKTPNPDSPLDQGVQDGILYRSWINQQALVSPAVVRARAAERERGRLFVEYPVLDPHLWCPLTPELLWGRFDHLFPSICLIVDYVHLLGIVHCDLKFGNFVVRTAGTRIDVRLIDLDFLTKANERPQHLVFGAPDHIAPEIRNNDRVYQQSDQYSLGMSLVRAFDEGDSPAGILPAERLPAVRELAEQMTHEDPVMRPRVLISALFEQGLIGEPEFRSLERRLVSMLLVSHFHRADKSVLGDEKEVRSLVEERAHVLNIPDEIYGALAEAYQHDRRASFGAFRDFLAETPVERTGDYWRTHPSNESLRCFQEKLDAVRDILWPDFDCANSSPEGMAMAVAEAERERAAGRPVAAYLRLKRYTAKIAAGGDALDATAYSELREKLMKAAEGLGRYAEAERLQVELLDCEPADEAELFRRRFHRIWLLGSSDRFAETRQLLLEMMEDPTVASDPVRYLKVLRVLVFAEYRVGDSSHVAELAELLEAPNDYPGRERAIGYYVLANVWRVEGELDRAEVALHRSTELARAHGAWDQVLTNLDLECSMYFDEGKYREAVHCGLLSFRMSRRRGVPMTISQLSEFVVVSLRLGRSAETEYWMSQCLARATWLGAVESLASIYQTKGFVGSQTGDLPAARQAFRRVLEFPPESLPKLVLAQAWNNLAETALFQGQPELVRAFTARSAQHLFAGRTQAFQYEIELQDVLSDFHYGSDPSTERLERLLKILMDYRYRHYGSVCAFHLLLYGSSEVRRRTLEVLRDHAEVFSASEAPMFRSMALLTELYERENRYTAEIQVFKEVFRLLNGVGLKFLAAQAAARIAGLYAESNAGRLARNYYRQAKRLAEGLENKILVGRYDQAISALSDIGGDQRRLLSTMHGISEILKNIQDYETSLQRLVEFAVNETGAERGALLLKVGQTSDLYVAAYFNCDEGSLTDIRDFSSSVPLDATRALEPLIIENALTDARTQNYKSVIYHNILSVLCVPIMFEGKALGTLYLDHHTIPALFEKDDVTYIFAITNFLALMLSAVQKYKSINIVNRELIEELRRTTGQMVFITRDEAVLAMLRGLPEIARSDAAVLLVGESGTGKEILARRIHALSLRAEKPFVPLNCAALPESLVESELFGIQKGVATDVAERDGKFAAADGGTLFLDEIGEMPMAVQAKVLRVVEYRQYERVGSNRTLYSDVRFIYATNKNLADMVRQSTFRQDLFYRINVCVIEIPPLRERPRDIPVLIEHFLEQFCARRTPPKFSSAVIETLTAYGWPGNVRELRNFIERICIVSSGREIGLSLLTKEMRRQSPERVYDREEAASGERERLREAFHRHNGNQSAVARELHMTISTVRRRLSKYGLIG